MQRCVSILYKKSLQSHAVCCSQPAAQRQLQNAAVHKLFRHVNLVFEQVLEPKLLDFKVALQVLDFFIQRNFFLLLYTDPQDAGKPVYHFADLASFILYSENVDRFQSVKEEVRLDLRLRHASPRRSSASAPFDLRKQIVDPVHQIVEPFRQRSSSSLFNSRIQIPIFHAAHKPYDDSDRPGNPIHKQTVEHNRRNQTEAHNDEEPLGKGSHLL